ncbi:MAG TPA: type I restriction-modification system subunit M, partial [Muricauda sp.]|nr:type I restriction-modification system subunit M [Allomuricauda sp.]
EKDGNKNKLSAAHIDAIIDTYRTRSTKDKFSYVSSLEEVAENDYNLNIPRYVDTFEEEEPVDLDQVATDLQNLEKDMAETDAVIADFCQQLNLKTPF